MAIGLDSDSYLFSRIWVLKKDPSDLCRIRIRLNFTGPNSKLRKIPKLIPADLKDPLFLYIKLLNIYNLLTTHNPNSYLHFILPNLHFPYSLPDSLLPMTQSHSHFVSYRPFFFVWAHHFLQIIFILIEFIYYQLYFYKNAGFLIIFIYS